MPGLFLCLISRSVARGGGWGHWGTLGGAQVGVRRHADCAPGAQLQRSRGPAAHSLAGQVRAACSTAASPAPALGCQPASHGVTSAPPLLGPSPRRAIPGLGAEGWGQGSRRGKKPQPLGKAGGPGDSLRCALVPLSGPRGEEEEEGWAGASEGIFLSRLESDAGGSVLPRSLPGDGNLLHFPGAGSPTLPTSPHHLAGSLAPSSFRAPRPARQDPDCPANPLFGERQPQTPGGRGWGWGLTRSRGSVVQHVRLM